MTGSVGQGIAPFVAINFTTYETLRQTVMDKHDGRMPIQWGPLCGAASGTFAMTCTFPVPSLCRSRSTHLCVPSSGTYPFDLLRRRMMMQGQGGERPLYDSIMDACRKIYQFEGFGGFFRGMIPTYLKVRPCPYLSLFVHFVTCFVQVVPSVAISFGTYELCKRVAGE